jgi:hypothetical protein
MYTVIIPTLAMKEKRQKGRPNTRWREEADEDINITGIIKR